MNVWMCLCGQPNKFRYKVENAPICINCGMKYWQGLQVFDLTDPDETAAYRRKKREVFRNFEAQRGAYERRAKWRSFRRSLRQAFIVITISACVGILVGEIVWRLGTP